MYNISLLERKKSLEEASVCQDKHPGRGPGGQLPRDWVGVPTSGWAIRRLLEMSQTGLFVSVRGFVSKRNHDRQERQREGTREREREWERERAGKREREGDRKRERERAEEQERERERDR